MKIFSLFSRPFAEVVESIKMSAPSDVGDTSRYNTGAVPKSGRRKNSEKTKTNRDKAGTGSGVQDETLWQVKFEETAQPAGAGEVAAVHAPLPRRRGKKRSKTATVVEEVAPKKSKRHDNPLPERYPMLLWDIEFIRPEGDTVTKDPNEDMEAAGSSTSSAAAPRNLKRKGKKAKVTDSAGKKAKTNEAKDVNRAEEMEVTDDTGNVKSTNGERNNNQSKKDKKRKHQKKQPTMKAEGEPEAKIRKQSISEEDELTGVLHSLHIGPEPKIERKEDSVPAAPKPSNGKRGKKHRKAAASQTNEKQEKQEANASAMTDEFDLQQVVKWTKKMWNKERRGAIAVSTFTSSIVVENLPVIMTSVYRTKLIDLFQKYGSIKRIGTAKVNSSTDGDATFNTTIYYDSETAANKALNEDHTHFAGSVIRVRRPQPAYGGHDSRAFGDMSMERLRKIFSGAGAVQDGGSRARSSTSTVEATVEIFGAEEVQRAQTSSSSESTRDID